MTVQGFHYPVRTTPEFKIVPPLAKPVLPPPRKLQHFEVYETSPHARPVLDGIAFVGWPFKREVQITVRAGQWLARVSQQQVIK